ncbi:hypothetical protein [Erythrobacter sp. EC-HK427]|uniref:hypothetical protein n=1 Tax=Erythrobacter sp. EC-HK427 TaxID=2038396 RepID=UPI001257842F|nr:hypothetical protein [Erythrobacter sp. EC-HK427]VVT09684.1 conserved membrane hypothetical protein [Erythrobacter sp. EC-HK427]
MVLPLVFLALLCTALALGWQAGTRNDRQLVAVIALSAFASLVAEFLFAPSLIEESVALIDLVLLIFLVRFALRSDRYWPIWFAGIHAVITILAISATFVPMEAFRLDLLGGFWAMVALGLMTIGLLHDRQSQTT